MELHQGWPGFWLILASFAAGVLNAVAGGGSLLSFPALLGAGVAPIQANATNTVALWPGQIGSIAGYIAELKANLNLVLPISSAALLGGLAGAIVLLHTGQATFMTLVPWLMLFAAVLFAISGPVSRWLLARVSRSPERGPALAPLWLSVTAVCFYVGYFGAGAGFLLMSILTLFGIEKISHVNALKVVAAASANGIAIATFIVEGKVAWRYCLLMMIAAAAGGFLGAHYSRRLNPRFLRVLVVSIGLGMAAYFFWKDSPSKYAPLDGHPLTQVRPSS